MGMALALSTVSDENLAKILADPPLVWKIIAPDDPEAYESARAETAKRSRSILGRLFGRPSKAAPEASLSFLEEEVQETDLDKSWHGIHFMLTQTAWEGKWPLNFLVGGGAQVGEIEVGYGPARALTAAEVNDIAAALEKIDEAHMRARFNPGLMTKLDIYPSIWDRDPADDDTFGYCMEYFTVLKDFISDASSRNVGLIVSLT